MKYVLLQFLFLFYIIFNVSFKDLNTYSIIILTLALGTGLSAIFTIGIFNVSIFPEVNEKTRLIQKGPYRILRHPMYTSLCLLIVAVLISNPRWDLFLSGLLLLLTLILKLSFEEKKLLHRFPEYKKYQEKTYRLIPYIY